MEPDRYKQNKNLYVVGMVFLIISLSLFAFSAYILPHLLLKWRYSVPEFISHWRQWLQMQHQYSEEMASLLIFLFFFLLAFFSAVIAYATSNRIDDEIYTTETSVEPARAETINENKKTLMLVLKITIIILVAILMVTVFELLIYHPPHPPYIPTQ